MTRAKGNLRVFSGVKNQFSGKGYFYNSHLGFISAFSFYFSLIAKLSLVGHLFYLNDDRKEVTAKIFRVQEQKVNPNCKSQLQEDKHLALNPTFREKAIESMFNLANKSM